MIINHSERVMYNGKELFTPARRNQGNTHTHIHTFTVDNTI